MSAIITIGIIIYLSGIIWMFFAFMNAKEREED